MFVNENPHMLKHMRRDYRIILDVNHCLPLLFKAVYLVIHVYALFACPQTSGDFRFFESHLSEREDHRMGFSHPVIYGSWGCEHRSSHLHSKRFIIRWLH